MKNEEKEETKPAARTRAKRRVFSERFKRKVIAAVERGMKPADASRKFHVSAPNITVWRHQYAGSAELLDKKKGAKPNGVHVANPSTASFAQAVRDIAEALAKLGPEDRKLAVDAIAQLVH